MTGKGDAKEDNRGVMPCCAAAASKVERLTLPDGHRVGIVNLSGIFSEVEALGVRGEESASAELLKRAKIYNYIPPKAEKDYERALAEEYVRFIERRKE